MTEAESCAGVPFGSERVLEAVRRSASGSASEIIGALRDTIVAFSADSTAADDATAIVINAPAETSPVDFLSSIHASGQTTQTR